MESDGNAYYYELIEVVASVETSRGNSTGYVVDLNDHVLVWFDDETIIVYDASSQRINYTSATNFKTETDGEVTTVGTNGEILNLRVFPVYPSGEELADLEQFSVDSLEA